MEVGKERALPSNHRRGRLLGKSWEGEAGRGAQTEHENGNQKERAKTNRALCKMGLPLP